jgi:hypothetical protein
LEAWHRRLRLNRLGITSQAHEVRICLNLALRAYPGNNHRPGPSSLLRHSIADLVLAGSVGPEGLSLASQIRPGRAQSGTGISTGYPSTTPLGLTLGPDLPWADEPSPGNLGHSAEEILTLHSLLMPAFALVSPPRLASAAASMATRRSPTDPAELDPVASAVYLSPVTFSAQNHSTSELLRTL